jgi:hypothetical protein
MQLLLQGAYLHFFPDLRSHLERRLSFALNRCRATARQATVSLKQRKSEWTCAIRVKLQGRSPLRVDATGPLPSGAIDEATGRLADKAARVAVPRTRGGPRRTRAEAGPAQPQWGGRSLEFVPRTRRHR